MPSLLLDRFGPRRAGHVQVNVKNDCAYTVNGSEVEKTETEINAEVNCERGTKDMQEVAGMYVCYQPVQ
jgi:hypothetical protein